MKLLLDTHIWLWRFREPSRLGRRLLRHLNDAENELWLSPMSTWEALTLHYKGRIRIKEELSEWLALATAGTQEAPFTHEIAVVARGLQMHRDPAGPHPGSHRRGAGPDASHRRPAFAGIGNDPNDGEPVGGADLEGNLRDGKPIEGPSKLVNKCNRDFSPTIVVKSDGCDGRFLQSRRVQLFRFRSGCPAYLHD